MKNLEKIKQQLIDEEVEFIKELKEDYDDDTEDYDEKIDMLRDELNSCETLKDIVCVLDGMGYDEQTSYERIISMLDEMVG